MAPVVEGIAVLAQAGNGLIDNRTQAHAFTATESHISSYDDLCLGIFNAAAQGLHAEARIDNRMHRANPGTGQHGNHTFQRQRHINNDAVALLHPEGTQTIGGTRDEIEKLAVGDLLLLALF